MNSVSAKEMEIFNTCLAARDSAASATTRAYLHLVRPIEQFPVHSTEEIRAAAENRVDAIALRIQAVNAAQAAQAAAVGAGLEAAKRGEPTPFLSLFRSRAPEPVSAPERTSEYDYTHKVETCPCGICHKARVDSGTDQAYTDSIRARVNAVTEKLTQEHKARTQ